MRSLDPQHYHQRARELWESGHPEAAISAWRKALACDPAFVEGLVSLSWALGRQGQVEEGLSLAQRALEAGGDDPRSHHVAGELCFFSGRYAEAEQHFRRALALDDKSAPLLGGAAHAHLADALYMLERFPEAAEEYQRALALGADEAYCRLWLGWSKHQLGDQRAAEQFQRACEVSPDWHEPFYAAGYCHCAQGDYARAKHCLEQALSLYPEDDEQGRAAAACELANALRGCGDLPRAIQLYQQSLALDPTHPVARFNLGLAFAEQGDCESALAAFEVAAQLDPQDQEIQVERGRAYLELGRYDQAVEAYQAALSICAENAEALAGLGLAYYSLGLYDTAADYCQRAVELAPEEAGLHYNLALSLEAAGRHAEADTAIERAWTLGQDDPELCVSIARTLVSQGRNLEAAARAARKACLLELGNAAAHDALAMALAASGKHQEALPIAREAVRLMPEAAEYRYSLGLVQQALADLAAARASFTRALELAPDFEEARQALRQLDHLL
jgi:tetratricopeptide (TPR) repeat protein